MDFLFDVLKTYWYYFVIGFLTLILAGVTSYLIFSQEKEIVPECNKVSYVETEEETNTIFVDVKGAVNKPGVYEVTSTSIINDVIKEAGGFTKKAYTNNINLSKKLVNEMVIYVYTKTEYKKLNEKEENVETITCPTNNQEITSCIESGSSVITVTESDEITKPDNEKKEDLITEVTPDNNSKISINTASKDELMQLDGIGEAKAENIIKYRSENGGFKSIEDIMNVSGIGEAAYEKIKESITI